MRGYAYLDVDGNVFYKQASYIETENPFFWTENAGFVLKWWKFDTDDLVSMRNMLLQLKSYQVRMETVMSFLDSINFDLNRLKRNENTVQPG